MAGGWVGVGVVWGLEMHGLFFLGYWSLTGFVYIDLQYSFAIHNEACQSSLDTYQELQ